MAKNRKIPFGYKIEFGQIEVNRSEADCVEHAFRQYAAGASYKELAEHMQYRGVPYLSGKAWNKNMIARILADIRYTGSDGWPQIIESGLYMSAEQKKGTKKQVPIRTELQKVMRQLGIAKYDVDQEKQLLEILNALIADPMKIVLPALKKDFSGIIELEIELARVCDKRPIDEEYAKQLVYQIAAERYAVIGTHEYETERLRRLFGGHPLMEEIDVELLGTAVCEIHADQKKMISIKLKNSQIVCREVLV